jgi:hypothetical protein
MKKSRYPELFSFIFFLIILTFIYGARGCFDKSSCPPFDFNRIDTSFVRLYDRYLFVSNMDTIVLNLEEMYFDNFEGNYLGPCRRKFELRYLDSLRNWSFFLCFSYEKDEGDLTHLDVDLALNSVFYLVNYDSLKRTSAPRSLMLLDELIDRRFSSGDTDIMSIKLNSFLIQEIALKNGELWKLQGVGNKIEFSGKLGPC